MPDPTTSSSTSPSPRSSTTTKPSDSPPTDRWRVRLSHPRDNKRTVFSSISESRARRHIVNRFPRGDEAYLEGPDGTTEAYAHERQGPYGEDVDQWAPFDPDAYVPPEEQPPPGESAWADVES
jgi:hypothetical protein